MDRAAAKAPVEAFVPFIFVSGLASLRGLISIGSKARRRLNLSFILLFFLSHITSIHRLILLFF